MAETPDTPKSVIAPKFSKILEVMNCAMTDTKKFENGNKAAGTRVRQAMQEIKRITQEIRETVSDIKNADNY